MLATIAALQLVVLSQVGPPPREVTPDEPVASEDAPPAGAQNPPLPSKPGTSRPDAGAPPATGSAATPAA
ncbi:MAG TPA: hypothetical protein VF841_09795, partial [Anaeromyxobacter sp.]